MNCVVCEGKGFVKAAPVQVMTVFIGSNPEPEFRPSAAWAWAVDVPCWACGMENLAVVA